MTAPRTQRFRSRHDGLINRRQRVAFRDACHRGGEVTQQPVMHAVDPAMQMQIHAANPGTLNDRRRGNAPDLHFYIEFAQPIELLLLAARLIEHTTMLAIEHRQRLEPVVHQRAALLRHRALHPPQP